MARQPQVPRPEDFDEALAQLVNQRGRRAAAAAQLVTLKESAASVERQIADLDRDIAARTAALKAAHKDGDFWEWAGRAGT